MATAEQWRARVGAYADDGGRFTIDDLLAEYGDDERRALGRAMREAHKAGKIRPVTLEASTDPHRRGALVRVWEGVPTRVACWELLPKFCASLANGRRRCPRDTCDLLGERPVVDTADPTVEGV